MTHILVDLKSSTATLLHLDIILRSINYTALMWRIPVSPYSTLDLGIRLLMNNLNELSSDSHMTSRTSNNESPPIITCRV